MLRSAGQFHRQGKHVVHPGLRLPQRNGGCYQRNVFVVPLCCVQLSDDANDILRRICCLLKPAIPCLAGRLRTSFSRCCSHRVFGTDRLRTSLPFRRIRLRRRTGANTSGACPSMLLIGQVRFERLKLTLSVTLILRNPRSLTRSYRFFFSSSIDLLSKRNTGAFT